MSTTMSLAPKEPTNTAIEVARKYGTPPIFARELNGAMVYDKYYREIVSEWCQSVYSSAAMDQAADQTLNQIPKWIRVLSGDHWFNGRPSYRATPVVNRTLRYWLELESIMSDVHVSSYCHSENKDYTQIAENVTKMGWANWQGQDADERLAMTVQHGSFGLGFTKVGINPRDMEVTFLPAGCDQVVTILPSMMDFQESGGVCYRAWKPISWFYKHYPMVAKNIKAEATGWHRAYPSRPYDIPEYTWSTMNPALRSFLAVNEDDPQKGVNIDEYGRVPMALHREFWFQDDHINTSKLPIWVGSGNYCYRVMPGCPVYPFGRLICTAGDDKQTPLYDGPNIHWHGLYPFPPLRLRPAVWLFAGLSVFSDLLPLNQSINQILADFMDYLKQSLNPTVVCREGCISDAAWEEYYPGMPAAKLIIKNRNEPVSNVFRFERPDAAGVGIIPQALGLLLRLFDEQAGLIDSGQIAGKKQMPSGEAIEQIQNIRQTVFRHMARRCATHVKQIGYMQMCDIFQFYTKRKIVRFLGEDGLTWQNLDWDPSTYVPYLAPTQGVESEPFRRGREFISNFQYMVTTGTALPAQRQAHASIAAQMNARGKLSLYSTLEKMRAAGFEVEGGSEAEIQRIIDEQRKLGIPKPPRGGGGQQRGQKV